MISKNDPFNRDDISEDVSGPEVECAVRNFFTMQQQDQAVSLRRLLYTMLSQERVLEQVISSVKGTQPLQTAEEPVLLDIAQSYSDEEISDFKLAAEAAKELELMPLPYRVGIADDGSYFLRIDVPEKVGVLPFAQAIFRLLRAMPVDNNGFIMWRSPHFDPFDPATCNYD